MAITINKSTDSEAIIVLGETFDFNCVEEFRKVYETIDIKSTNAIAVDFQHANYMDSSALGMLLKMKNFFNEKCGEIRIINLNSQLRKIFTICQFDKKFVID